MNKKFKIIDFEKNGNQVKFYIGTEDCNDYYGDDWDDTPYEHNAGIVYDRFIAGWFVKSFDFDDVVMEPCEGSDNSRFCKDDMRNRRVPCICVLPKKYKEEYAWYYAFEDISGNANSINFYFGDEVDIEKEDVHLVKNYREDDAYISFEFEKLSEEERKVALLATQMMSDTIKYVTLDVYLEEITKDGFKKNEKFIKTATKTYDKYLKIASDIFGVNFEKKPISRFVSDRELSHSHYLNQYICYKSDDVFKIGKIHTRYNWSAE